MPLRYCGLQKTKNYTRRNSAAQLQRAARERADDQARRIPWQRLYDARNQYIDWQEFNLWARSILEVEEADSGLASRDSQRSLPRISSNRERTHTQGGQEQASSSSPGRLD